MRTCQIVCSSNSSLLESGKLVLHAADLSAGLVRKLLVRLWSAFGVVARDASILGKAFDHGVQLSVLVASVEEKVIDHLALVACHEGRRVRKRRESEVAGFFSGLLGLLDDVVGK